jgi:hypothetical protein
VTFFTIASAGFALFAKMNFHGFPAMPVSIRLWIDRSTEETPELAFSDRSSRGREIIRGVQ